MWVHPCPARDVATRRWTVARGAPVARNGHRRYPLDVTSVAKKILQEALALSVADRRRIAEELMASVPDDGPEAVALAWDREVVRRLESVDRDEDPSVDWAVAACELRSKHSSR